MRRTAILSAKERNTNAGFSLIEILVGILVLAMLLLITSQLVGHTSTITRSASKHYDTDSEARAVFDRMAPDFNQMLKRTDVDYYLKSGTARYPGHSAGHSKGGSAKGQTDLNDYIGFYTQVPGYSVSSPSPLSLVSYRINGLTTSASYNRLERLGKGLVWNGNSAFRTNGNQATIAWPLFFKPVLLTDNWPMVGDNSSDPQGSFETIGPGAFRFEYYYLLKSGKLNDSPFDNIDASHTTVNAFADVESIVVTIAVIDPQSRALLTEQNILDLQNQMNDFQTQHGKGPVKTGVIENQWYQVVTDPTTYPVTATMPKAALSAIRIYSSYFDLRTP